MPTTHAIRVRLGIRADIAGVLRVERETGGCWEETNFLAAIRYHNFLLYVAERAGAVVGFVVYELRPGALFVRNFAALVPDARAALKAKVAKVAAVAAEQKRCVVWGQP